MEGLKKTMKTLDYDTQCLGQDSNQTSPEYKFRALPLDQHVQCLPHHFQLNAPQHGITIYCLRYEIQSYKLYTQYTGFIENQL
jgi:hypothetical protein